MRVLVILAIAASCSGQIITPLQYVSPVPVAIKYQGVDPFGQTTFGHQSIEQTRHEVRLADGRVVGQFSYIDPNGEPAITYFEAGPNGYRVLGSNILPEAPAADPIAPAAPVAYTPEVEQARAEFMKLYDEAAAAAAAAPDDVPVAVEDPTYAAAETPAAEEPAAAAPAAEETPAAVEPVRRKREVQRVPLPYLQPVPTEYTHTYETRHLEPVKEAATPADTTKIELTKKEHEIKIPGIKYVQPFAEVKPLQYTVLSPQAGLPFQPFFYPGYAYPTLLSPTPAAPAVAEE